VFVDPLGVHKARNIIGIIMFLSTILCYCCQLVRVFRSKTWMHFIKH